MTLVETLLTNNVLDERQGREREMEGGGKMGGRIKVFLGMFRRSLS